MKSTGVALTMIGWYYFLFARDSINVSMFPWGRIFCCGCFTLEHRKDGLRSVLRAKSADNWMTFNARVSSTPARSLDRKRRHNIVDDVAHATARTLRYALFF
jgi:hypothetical protein